LPRTLGCNVAISASRPPLNFYCIAVSNDNRQVTTPWHLWIVGVFSLLWNGMGAFDYGMTESRSAS
jgi:hypothetical protein